MATASATNNPYVGKPVTPAGVLAPDHAKRHGLTATRFVPGDPTYRKHYGRGDRRIKAIFESVKTYRLLSHNVTENKLSNSLRLAVHYFLEPMARGYAGGNQSAGSQDNSNSLANVAAPLKV